MLYYTRHANKRIKQYSLRKSKIEDAVKTGKKIKLRFYTKVKKFLRHGENQYFFRYFNKHGITVTTMGNKVITVRLEGRVTKF